MLHVLVGPTRGGLEKVVLGKSVYDSPDHDDCRVEELLRHSAILQPWGSVQRHDEDEDSVAHEAGAHDVVGEALSEMSSAAQILQQADRIDDQTWLNNIGVEFSLRTRARSATHKTGNDPEQHLYVAKDGIEPSQDAMSD